MGWNRYRCFLPDLAGFAALHCARPSYQRRPQALPPDVIRDISIHLKTEKNKIMAEREGFEPSIRFRIYDFQSYPFGLSGTSPCWPELSLLLNFLRTREGLSRPSLDSTLPLRYRALRLRRKFNFRYPAKLSNPRYVSYKLWRRGRDLAFARRPPCLLSHAPRLRFRAHPCRPHPRYSLGAQTPSNP